MAWTSINAWREVLARIFDGFALEHDVSPEWLINPETGRRLKLDVLYPEIGVAIRFHGLQGPARRARLSLEEEHQLNVREAARDALCETHGVSLVGINVVAGEPKAILRELSMALSNASRRLANSDRPPAEKGLLIEQTSQARSRLSAIGRRLHQSEDLQLYAELWQDRQFAETPQPQSSSFHRQALAYAPGMAVRHVAFGDGVVQTIQPDQDEQLITVLFADGTQKTFAASLVSDKLIPG